MYALHSVLVMGAGALGAAYGTTILQAQPGLVRFLAQGRRAGRLRSEGVVVNGTHFAVPVVEAPENDGMPEPVDLILLTVKYHHLSAAVETMRPYVGPQTIILSLLNGIDSEEILAQSFAPEQILYGMSLGIDAVRDMNRVTYSSLGTIYFGEARNEELSQQVQAVQNLFTDAGIRYETPADMLRSLWYKFMINVGINQVSAVLELTYRAFQRKGYAHRLMESAMREVIAIAQKRGIDLGDADIENWNQVIPRLSPEGKTSMLQDVQARRKTEVEMLAGKVVELGRIHRVPTPVNEVLGDMLKAKEQEFEL